MSKKIENFALTNPISLITGKDKTEFTREDLLKVIIEKQIERLSFHYTGIDDKIKELKIPAINRKQVETILTEGERVDGSSLFKGIVDAGKSDLYVVPVYKTAFLNPFGEPSLHFVCRFFNKDGELAEFTPDNILLKAKNLLAERTGLELYALGELEFYLIGRNETQAFPLQKQHGYHATAPFVKNGALLDEILGKISSICGDVKYAHNEVGCLEKIESNFEALDGKSAEQFEVEFLPAPIDEAADYLVVASWIVRNVAHRHGVIATFFPKIEVGHAGNGLHIHMALMKNGENVMTSEGGELSQEAKLLIGGLCHYAPSLTAFGNMVSASYLRLVPNQEAPTKICWSEMNRSALIRVPLAWQNVDNLAQKINPQQKEPLKETSSRQTVELRSPDGSANAHLLLAGIVMAAEWGLTNKSDAMDLAKASRVTGNIHQSSADADLQELATTCAESGERLLQQRGIYERDGIFTSKLVDFVAEKLQAENDRALNNRLMSLSEEERAFQSRRIMHRDLHKH